MVNRKTRQKKKLQRQKLRVKRSKELEVTLDFPFLKNGKGTEYIRRSKVMFIMRGLPGSGKSTVVKFLQERYPESVVCSADCFFTKNGKYVFDQDLLKDAHDSCQTLAYSSCEKNNSVIIIDNTSIQKWEAKYYLDLAVRFNYVVILVLPKTLWRFDPVDLAQRNTHGVSLEVLQKKVKLFQEMIPLYYGWFLNELDSQKLLDLGNKYRQLCLDHCHQLREVLLSYRSEAVTDSQNDGDDEKWLEEYFSRMGAAGILHCTSRFCRWGKVEGSTSYHRLKLVQEACGKLYQFSVTGLTITPRTIAMRVKLDKQQLGLWENDAKETQLPTVDQNSTDLPGEVLREISPNQNCKQNSTQQKGSGYKAENVPSITLQKSMFLDNPFSALDTENESGDSADRKGMDLDKENNSVNSSVSCIGLSAHITLGYATGYRALQSGPDIVNIVKTAAENKPILSKNLEDAVMNYYGEGRCEIIFKSCVKINSIFSGHY